MCGVEPAPLAVIGPSCSSWERKADDDDALLLMLSLLLLLLMGTLPMSLIMRRVFALIVEIKKAMRDANNSV